MLAWDAAQGLLMNGLHFLEGTSAVGTTAELDGEVVTALAPTFYCGLGGRPIDGTPAARGPRDAGETQPAPPAVATSLHP